MSYHDEETNPHFWSDFSAPPLIPPEPRQPWDGHLYHPGQIQRPDQTRVTPRPRHQDPRQPSPVVPRSRSRSEHDGQIQQPDHIQLRPHPRQSRPHPLPPVVHSPRSPTEYSHQSPGSPPSRDRGRPTQSQRIDVPHQTPMPSHGRHKSKPQPTPPQTPRSSKGRHKSKPQPSHRPQPHMSAEQVAGRPFHPRENLMYPESNKTKPITWFGAVFCVILWLVIILGGLLVLVIYLMYRPRTPHFEISSATLNAVYLDMGYLLNSDVTVLANFTNPNEKVNVDFSYVILKLYYGKYLISNQYIEPFSAFNTESKLANVEFITSQVRLPLSVTQQLVTQIQRNRVTFEVDGIFHARSNFGSLLRYSYWLYGHCQIQMTGPPSGVLLTSHCRTKD